LKKLLLLFGIVIFSIGVKDLHVSAEKQHKHDSQGMEQAMDHFILSQFHDEMMQAINDYYKKEVRVQYNWWDKNYDVVEIDQFEKGNELSHPFILKFTVETYHREKKGRLGTDTITFGVTPLEFNKGMDQKNLAASKVEFLNFTHMEPNKNN
jgi:hypothetical protein